MKPAATRTDATLDRADDSTPETVGQWPLSRPFPALLTAADLRLVLGSEKGPMPLSTYHDCRKRGDFRRFEVEYIGGVRYSGQRVRDFVLGNPGTHARTFGAKRVHDDPTRAFDTTTATGRTNTTLRAVSGRSGR